MCEVFTKSRLLIMYKMIQEIILTPRADSSNAHNFRVNSWGFKDDESETEAKTNSGHRVHPLLVGSLLLACTEPAQRPLLALSGKYIWYVNCTQTVCSQVCTGL